MHRPISTHNVSQLPTHQNWPNILQALIIFPFLNKTTPVLNICLYSSTITITNSVKYLGVIIDNNQFFDELIKMLESKVAYSVGILSKLKY